METTLRSRVWRYGIINSLLRVKGKSSGSFTLGDNGQGEI